MRCTCFALSAFLWLLGGHAAADQVLRVTVDHLAIDEKVVAVEPTADLALVRTDAGRFHVIKAVEGIARYRGYIDWEFEGERPAGMLPQSRLAPGEWNVGAAWLSDATRRYGHGVLGDRLEASTLSVRWRDRSVDRISAGDNAVFEDLVPRLVDLDGDRLAEIIVVKSYLERGAALAVIGLDAAGELAVLAETPPIGRANRWLNPIGAADFDGDGAVEIATVATPHIGGWLMVWEWRDGALVLEHEAAGFSNHAIGSTELGLSAIADLDGDGLMDLAVPDRHRDRMRMISLAGGRFRELADVALGGVVATAIAPVGGALVFGLEDGRLIALRIPQ